MKGGTDARTHRRTSRWLRTLLLCGCAAVPTAPAFAQCPDGTLPPCRGVARPAPTAVTVAVLPFDNLSRDSGDAYLASGLTDEITTRLTEIERLTVTSATVMRRYRGSDDPRRVAGEMRVANLVAGSVRRDRQRLRVTVELINARSGVALWRNAYNQPDTMLLDIQADIASRVATAITGRLLPEERARMDARPRHDPRAWDLFMRGRYDLGQRTTRALLRALQSFESAAGLDSTFAEPLAGMAFTYSILQATYYDSTVGVSRDSLRVLSRDAAMRALRADSGSATAWAAAAFWQPGARERRAFMERAITLDPRNADVLYTYANVVGGQGDEAGRREYIRRAIAIDPRNSVMLLGLGMSHLSAREYPEALRWLDSAVSFRPEAYYFYSDRAMARLHTGDTAGVRADAALVRRLGYALTGDALLALLAARQGDTVTARAAAGTLTATIASRECAESFDCVLVAAVNAALGETEAAMGILQRANPGGLRRFMGDWMLFAEFDPIRQDPRFQALLARPFQ